MQVSFVIVSFNTSFVTRECVRQIVKEAPPQLKYEVIVVDNASADDTVSTLKEDFPFVILLENSSNMGYGSAHNAGVSVSNGSLVFLLNSDFLVNRKSIETALYLFRSKTKIVLGFAQKFQNGCRQRAVGILPGILDLLSDLAFLKRVMYRLACRRSKFESAWSVQRGFFLDGACLVFSRQGFCEVNGFDESFFFYAEDADICFRASQNGYEQLLVDTEPCVHYRGHATQEIDTNYDFKSRHYVRSYLMFCRKNRPLLEYWFVRVVLPIKFSVFGLGFFIVSFGIDSYVEKYRLQFACLRALMKRS